MTLMTTISLLSAVFAMVVLSEIFKLKKEVRKLNKITKYILEKITPKKRSRKQIEKDKISKCLWERTKTLLQ